jgi:hypothetical protein
MSTSPSSPDSLTGGDAMAGGRANGAERLGNGGMSSTSTGGREAEESSGSIRNGRASLKLVRRGRVPLPEPERSRGIVGGDCVSSRRE